MNLSSDMPDELAHTVIQPCLACPVVMRGYNTPSSMHLFVNSYIGADAADVITDGKRFWNNATRRMNYIHESQSCCQPDIFQVAE